MAVRTWLVMAMLTAAAGACSATGSDADYGGVGGASGSHGGSGGSGAGAAGAAGYIQTGGAGGDSDINPPCYSYDKDIDNDQDGWTQNQGDCNDCSRQMNPGAYDYPGDHYDQDCSGQADDEPTECDQDLDDSGNDAMDAARTMGLCRVTQPDATGKDRTWGVLSAAYVYADGSSQSAYIEVPTFGHCTGDGGPGAPPNALSHSLLTAFGQNVGPRQGKRLVVLSTGIARPGVNDDSPARAQMCTRSPTPPGFPTPSRAACPDQQIDDTPVANDPMALELRIRAPSNAKSLAFNFDFYTFEYPKYICTHYNDFFVALLYSQHPSVPSNHNISFDSQNNPVSVNNGFLEVCTAGDYGGKHFACPMGMGELLGTGYEGRAATGWLESRSPVKPGEDFTIRFALWDMGDEFYDSMVLLDNFSWDVEETEINTERPPPR